ncbi:protein TIFY 10A [Solanum tuberosum]|uniref:Protein TIFY n=2 Tax=Solanum tuberosum TaxID=4113 RepID=M0ZT91_SOLTU|nr:PREDICTED: protein TIFY 10A [Solanum tuberosum]
MGSSENVDSGKVTGQKSQFSQTCNLLSQFLKKKGSVGDLNNLGIYKTTFEPTGSQQTATTTTTTMNLLPMIEKSSDSSSSSSSVETNPQKPMNLFPQEFDFSKEQSTKKTESWKFDQPEKAQMTIFYGGQVIVFDDFPADKANEIMKLANKQNPTNNFTYTMMKNQKTSDQSGANFGNKLIQELPKCQVSMPQPSVADLPIARRNSLTRFLEKRKDRVTSIAPYQISSNKKSKNEENKAWLGLGAQFVKTEQYF